MKCVECACGGVCDVGCVLALKLDVRSVLALKLDVRNTSYGQSKLALKNVAISAIPE